VINVHEKEHTSGWKVMYEALNLKSTSGKPSTLVRALELVEQTRLQKKYISESFARGVKLVNGKPDLERLELLRQREQEVENPPTNLPKVQAFPSRRITKVSRIKSTSDTNS
jgi:hypothetical protein